jgi:ABC-type Fe3+ transport system permease subunit
MSKKDNEKALWGFLISAIVFGIGYYFLNHIATLEEPPLGNTIHILIGSTLMAVSALGVVLIIKYLYDKQRKRKRRANKRRKHKIVFLKNQKKESKE